MAKRKIDISNLTSGYKFPETNFRLDSARVAAYLKAVEDPNTVFQNTSVVPPTAAVAIAMAELSNSISFPDGTIHVTQELTFSNVIFKGETITSTVELSRVQKRGSLHLISISLNLCKKGSVLAISGKTEFILPLQEAIT